MKIEGVEGMTTADVLREVENGAKFVVYQYCISLLIVTLKRSSDVYFIKPGAGALRNGIGYTILSLLLGWWGIPWGPVWTIQSLVVNLGGGKDVTKEIVASMVPLALPPEEQAAFRELVDQRQPAQAPGPASAMTCAYCGAQLGRGAAMCESCGASLKRQRRTLPFGAFVAGGLAIVAVAVLGLQLWSRSAGPVSAPTRATEVPTNTPDADTRFLSCRDDVLENGSAEVLDEWLNSMESEELDETCLKVPDWAARVRQGKAAYERCPEPVDSQLVQLRVYEREFLDELFLCADMVIPCCDGQKNCNLDTAFGHCDRMVELDKLASQQVDDYNAAHADK